MGFVGNLVFYTTTRHRNPWQLILDIGKMARSEQLYLVRRSLGENHDWADFLADSQEPIYEIMRNAKISSVEFLGSVHTVEDLAREFRDGCCLSCDFLASPLAAPVSLATYRDIPEEIRGESRFHDTIFLRVGYHDIYEVTPDEGGHLFARPFLSLTIQGNGCPNDWPECRRRILLLPEVLQARQEFERICGPLEMCVHW